MEDKNIRKRNTSEEKVINKRRKTDDSANSDVLISMKDARKNYERYRLPKQGFKSYSEITYKRQRIVESILSICPWRRDGDEICRDSRFFVFLGSKSKFLLA